MQGSPCLTSCTWQHSSVDIQIWYECAQTRACDTHTWTRLKIYRPCLIVHLEADSTEIKALECRFELISTRNFYLRFANAGASLQANSMHMPSKTLCHHFSHHMKPCADRRTRGVRHDTVHGIISPTGKPVKPVGHSPTPLGQSALTNLKPEPCSSQTTPSWMVITLYFALI